MQQNYKNMNPQIRGLLSGYKMPQYRLQVGKSSASLRKLLMINPQNALCQSLKTAKDHATELQNMNPEIRG